MGWAIGFDENHKRDIGYGVPATCDHPECNAKIHRGLDYVCGGEPYGGDAGCGLYFCHDHLIADGRLCERCLAEEPHFPLKDDVNEWIQHKLTCPTWAEWRAQNPEFVAAPGRRHISPDASGTATRTDSCATDKQGTDIACASCSMSVMARASQRSSRSATPLDTDMVLQRMRRRPCPDLPRRRMHAAGTVRDAATECGRRNHRHMNVPIPTLIDEDELTCVIVEAATQMRRPPRLTAAEALAALSENAEERWREVARAVVAHLSGGAVPTAIQPSRPARRSYRFP